MKWNNSLILMIVLSCLAQQPLSAATNFWIDDTERYQARTVGKVADVNVMAKNGRRLKTNPDEIKAELLGGGDVDIRLPLPDGTMATYRFSRSSVMHQVLAAKYPQIQTFKAVDVNDPSNHGSFDITPQGFHGMYQHDGKWVFIDPEVRNDNGQYLAYYGEDAQPLAVRAKEKVIESNLLSTKVTATSLFSSRPLVGNSLRTYRLAMSAAAEYTAFHGGKENAVAAIATLITRVNEVYERDLSIRFELVANNDDIVYTNPFTDPFDNSEDDAEANASHLPTVVPNSQFDIGHVLNTGGGGLALVSGVCQNTLKSVGMTGTSQPTGDAFYIDYVAHELGHQLGANHTFNGTSFSCSGSNRESASAWEPGSGSTIMAYAGICGSQDLQANSDPHFHTGSIEEILVTADEAGCGKVTATQNTIPIAEAGDDLTMPSNTPFSLVGSGSDVDGDSLTYSWEQYDIGAASFSRASMVDDGSRPLFRSLKPSTSPERYLPDLSDYIVGSLSIGETMPTTTRALNFRLTVRDGKGGVATDEMKVKVIAGGSPFQVTEPANGAVLSGGDSAFVRWDVAGTDQDPISCGSVEILMSKNGGESFETAIQKATENDGEHEFTVDDFSSVNNLIMVRCISSRFYALSPSYTVLGTNNAQGVEQMSNRGGGSFVSIDVFLMFCLLCLIVRLRRLAP